MNLISIYTLHLAQNVLLLGSDMNLHVFFFHRVTLIITNRTITGCGHSPVCGTQRSRMLLGILGLAVLACLMGWGLIGCASGGQSAATQPTTAPAALSNSNNPNALVVGIAGSYTFASSGSPAPTVS